MSYRCVTSSCFIVAIFAAVVAWALHIATEPQGEPAVRLVFIPGGINDNWQRAVEGAKAAAKDVGIELQVRTPTADDSRGQQNAILRSINFAECDGVIFCPTDPESQLEVINEIAEKTKLTTVGNYYYRSKALSHVGFSPRGIANKIADLTLSDFPPGGKVLVLSSRLSNGSRNVIADTQLNDFKEQWAEWDVPGTSRLRVVTIAVGDGNSTKRTDSAVSTAIDSPDLAFIVALDSARVEASLRVIALRPRPSAIPIIAAFEPSAAVLDAVDDARIFAAISEDPYHDGYVSIVHTAKLCRTKSTERLPVAGYGSTFIPSEVVQKENLLNFRRRAKLRAVLANSFDSSLRTTEIRIGV